MLVRKAVKDSIAPEHDEIMKLRLHCELRNFGLSYNYTFFATVLWPFPFDITESPRNGKPSWEHSMWSQNNLLLHGAVADNLHLLDGLRLVDLSTVGVDPSLLVLFVGSVVSRE